MRATRTFLVIPLCLILCPALSQSVPASVQAEVIYGETSVEWPAPVPDSGLLLTVAGPEALYVRQEHPAGHWARFSLINEQGQPRPDGVYKWELVVQAGWQEASPVRSGWFMIQGGKLFAEGNRERQPVVVEETAHDNSLYVDSQGRVGIGTSVPRVQLHLKGSDPAFAIEDTQPGGREYVLRGDGSGDGSLGLFQATNGKAVWLIDAEGRMGINTPKPTSTLTVNGYIETTKGFLLNGRPFPAIGGFVGSRPLSTEGSSNNFFGTGAGASMTTGSYNSFFGANAGQANTTGYQNSFFGVSAGEANISGKWNSFFGIFAGKDNTTGNYNSIVGWNSGGLNTTGSYNCFFGESAGRENTTENFNTLIGSKADLDPTRAAGTYVTGATAIGYRSSVGRSNSLVLGGVNGFNEATTETFVGIGTTVPDRQLVVEGSQAIGKFRRYSATGPDFGPAFLFERARGTNTAPVDIVAGDYLGKVQFRGRVSGTMPEYGALTFIASDKNQNGRFSFVDRDLVTERLVVLNTGNVGIGTNAPTERLHVVGNLRITGSILYGAPATAVPDYVFEPNYKLMPLEDLEHYVRTEKHLPNIPKASEINDNGVNVGDLQMRLLEKIEELTLYTVAQAKQIQDQQKTIGEERRTNESQQAEMVSLKARLARLEALLQER